MTGRGIRIGTIFGIPIRIDYSWLVIVLLLTASLSAGFGQSFPYLSLLPRLALGLTASMLLFGSVLLHELSHAVVALRHGVGIRGITLFIFGGAAEMMDEPNNATAELRIAIAGPIMSLALAVAGWGIYTAGLGRAPLPLVDMVGILARMNLMLVAFNIVPGFPLDGGRVLRAALWGLWGSLSAATRVASGVGSFFGTMVIVMGFLWIFAYDNFVGGLWFVLIGFFLRSAARTSYQQLLLRQAVEGVKARDLMSLQLIWVSPDMPVVEAVDEIMLPRGLSEVPVTDNGRLLGELSLARLRAIDRSGWEKLYVADVMSRESLTQSVSPEEEALKVLMLLGQTERFLPVVERGELVGVVSRKEALRRLQLRLTFGR